MQHSLLSAKQKHSPSTDRLHSTTKPFMSYLTDV